MYTDQCDVKYTAGQCIAEQCENKCTAGPAGQFDVEQCEVKSMQGSLLQRSVKLSVL